MENEQIKSLIREVLREQGGVVPFHVHNNIDSPYVPVSNILGYSGDVISSGSVDGTSQMDITLSNSSDISVYRLIFTGLFTTTETSLHLTLNSDTSTNYYYALHRFGLVADADNHSVTTSGGLANNQQAYVPLYDGGTKQFAGDLTIFVGSGALRKIQGTLSTFDDLDTWFRSDVLGVWDNSVDTVTSIQLTAGQNFLAGTKYWLLQVI